MDEPIEVPDDILMIDLGDKNGQISLIRLYNKKVLFSFD